MTDPGAVSLIGLDEIRAAAARLRGVALRTPLLRLGEHAYLKPESLQPTGAFKLRGAYNAIAQLSSAQLGRGVVTHSSGNHGQAVAYAARLLGTRAVVVMPDNAPRVKVERVRQLGAQIEFVGPSHEERTARAHELAAREGLELIPSAADNRVIAGQGTAGLEIVEQLAEQRAHSQPLSVFVPVGGGGLAAGVATAVKSLLPQARVIGVEPALAADAADSLARGEIVRWSSEDVQRTMADGLRIEALSEQTFAHLRRYLDEVVVVDEEQIGSAVARAASEARLVLEPSGAVSLAALSAALSADSEAKGTGGTRVAVLSGGNVDSDRYIALLRRYHRR